ncbi:type III-B CRISPR module RAMP protein Cmr1 [candidate division KSB1 bacterium]|nr:type III-B CRISPR module RAMP protein Cmr1 [candidate division KSB1 bacterium]
MRKSIEVSLVSPAMIGGAEARKLDSSLALRPPSIRGQLRFWARALAGGAGLSGNYLHDAENKLFGSIQDGSPVLIRTMPLDLVDITNLELFPHKTSNASAGIRVPSDMIQLNSRYRIYFTIGTPHSYPIEKLKSVVWTWLHLGSIGRRSRRGYGSLIWNPQEKDLLKDFIDFDPQRDLVSTLSLANYLKTGLTKVFRVWEISNGTSERARAFDFFQLHSLDQVFVGCELCDSPDTCAKWENTRDSLQSWIHGFRYEKRLLHSVSSATMKTQPGEEKEMGYAQGSSRLASPMLWRLYRLQNGSVVPVLTWSPHSVHHLTRDTGMHDYLVQKLGFRTSLAEGTLAWKL